MNYYNNIFTKWLITGTLLIFSMALVVTGGCMDAPSNQALNRQGEKVFFDLKGFLNEEVERLSEMTRVTKKVAVGDEVEEKQMDDLDFTRELKPFTDSDLNRPAWTDKYEVDSLFNSKRELTRLDYRSLDPKFKTRYMSVEFNGKDVSKITIDNASKSSVAKTQQHLVYQPSSGFAIESTQAVSMMDETTFKIEVKF